MPTANAGDRVARSERYLDTRLTRDVSNLALRLYSYGLYIYRDVSDRCPRRSPSACAERLSKSGSTLRPGLRSDTTLLTVAFFIVTTAAHTCNVDFFKKNGRSNLGRVDWV